MIADYFLFAYKSIRTRRLRSWLTMIGIFIGIAAVVSLISLGQGLQLAIEEQFQQVGTNKIFITPGSGIGPPGASVEKLTEHDLELAENTKGVEAVGGIVFKFANVKFNDKTNFLPTHGIPAGGKEHDVVVESHGIKIQSGRDLKNSDKTKVIIGYRLAAEENLFGKTVKLRDKVEIAGKEFEVVGIVKKIGNPPDDSVVYMPLDAARDLYGVGKEFDFIFVKVAKGFTTDDVSAAIENDMRKDRGLDKGEENFQVQTFQDILATFTNIFAIVQGVVIGIAAISLLVGGIGIMNTMYMSVLERTKEIGVMKAVGAKNSHILTIFLIESGFYGLVGGTIGIAIGIGMAKAAEFFVSNYLGSELLRANISLFTVIGTLLFAFIVGAVSGIAPAIRAAKLKPVVALRYE